MAERDGGIYNDSQFSGLCPAGIEDIEGARVVEVGGG